MCCEFYAAAFTFSRQACLHVALAHDEARGHGGAYPVAGAF